MYHFLYHYEYNLNISHVTNLVDEKSSGLTDGKTVPHNRDVGYFWGGP